MWPTHRSVQTGNCASRWPSCSRNRKPEGSRACVPAPEGCFYSPLRCHGSRGLVIEAKYSLVMMERVKSFVNEPDEFDRR